MYKNGGAIDCKISYFVTRTQSVGRNMCKGNDKIEYLQFLYNKKNQIPFYNYLLYKIIYITL